MADKKPFSDYELKMLGRVRGKPPNDVDRFLDTITSDRKRFEETIDGYTKDWGNQKRKFQKRIEELLKVEVLLADQTATIEQLKKDAEIKDSLAEGVMTLAEVYEQLEDAKAEIGRLEGALKPFVEFTSTAMFKERSKNRYRFVKAVLECDDFKQARQALDAGKE